MSRLVLVVEGDFAPLVGGVRGFVLHDHLSGAAEIPPAQSN